MTKTRTDFTCLWLVRSDLSGIPFKAESFSSLPFAKYEQCNAETNHLFLPLNFSVFLIWFSYVHIEVVIGELWWRGIPPMRKKERTANRSCSFKQPSEYIKPQIETACFVFYPVTNLDLLAFSCAWVLSFSVVLAGPIDQVVWRCAEATWPYSAPTPMLNDRPYLYFRKRIHGQINSRKDQLLRQTVEKSSPSGWGDNHELTRLAFEEESKFHGSVCLSRWRGQFASAVFFWLGWEEWTFCYYRKEKEAIDIIKIVSCNIINWVTCRVRCLSGAFLWFIRCVSWKENSGKKGRNIRSKESGNRNNTFLTIIVAQKRERMNHLLLIIKKMILDGWSNCKEFVKC